MPYGDKKSYSFFKMKGSPHKMGTIEGTSAYKKKIHPPKPFDIDEDIEYQKRLKEKNAKLIKERKALYDAGKITKEQFESDKDEISRYIDF